VNWALPFAGALATAGALTLYGESVNTFGAQGLLDRLLSFVQTLVGFYIAALAAVASFNSPHLDKEMPPPSPTMRVKYNGVLQEVSATRRRFLSAMFAYLTALSFLFSLLAIGILASAGTAAVVLPTEIASWLKPLTTFVIMFGVFQMTSITFWGLFYLGERMLTPD
jgi:hypothetical protein